jgi:predicted glycoside hydrolase/deacetylase ChbG (UPF0249 family)
MLLMKAPRRLIIHADDLGLSPKVSRGILRAMSEGVVTSTSLLANFPTSREALAAAREEGRDVGWHLNLVQGRPLTAPGRIVSLVGRDGCFLPWHRLMLRAYAGRLISSEIKTELSAQYQVFADGGLKPSHVDGHLHAHLLPGVREALRDLIAEKAIPFVRVPWERGGLTVPRWPTRILLKTFRGAHADFWRSTGAQVLPFFGLALSDRPADPRLWADQLRHNPHPLAECMVHPGYFDSKEKLLLGEMGQGREAELQWLTSPTLRKLLRDLNYQLISYKDLRKIS